MPNSRRSYPPSLKAKVAIEAIRGQKTTAQIAQVYSIHPALVSTWKKQALDALPVIFQQPRDSRAQSGEAEKEELYNQIGRLKVELDWLKKRAGLLG
jgi:transposase-like protein